MTAAETCARRAGAPPVRLENGRLYFEARNGRDVGQTPSKFFAATQYKKTAGSAVSVKLGLNLGEAREIKFPRSGWIGVGKGDTAQHSWGGQPLAGVARCNVIGFMTTSTGSEYYTPPLNVC
jgi:hypothetical protein